MNALSLDNLKVNINHEHFKVDTNHDLFKINTDAINNPETRREISIPPIPEKDSCIDEQNNLKNDYTGTDSTGQGYQILCENAWTGFERSTGPTGIQGLFGFTGWTGTQGHTGLGIQGLFGLTGWTGIQGRTGIQGKIKREYTEKVISTPDGFTIKTRVGKIRPHSFRAIF